MEKKDKLEHNRRDLVKFIKRYKEIQIIYSFVKDLRKELWEQVRLTFDKVTFKCINCNSGCCDRNHLSNNDMLYIALTNKKFNLTREHLINKIKDNIWGCIFLSSKGCILDADCRPMVCIRYLCRTLEKELQTKHSKEYKKLKVLLNRAHRISKIFGSILALEDIPIHR